MKPDDLIEVIDWLGSPRLLVVGDLLLERSFWKDVRHFSNPVTPLPHIRHHSRPGCAAAVALMAAAFGCRVRVAGVVGNDANARELLDLLRQAGVGIDDVVVTPHCQTTVQSRFQRGRRGNRSLAPLQVASRCCCPLPAAIEEELLRRCPAAVAGSDGVLVIDLPQASWGPRPLKALFAAAASCTVPLLARPGKDADYGAYCGAAPVAVNRAEAGQAVGREVVTTADALAAGRQLARCCGAEAALVTLGCRGLVLSESRAPGRLMPVWPSFRWENPLLNDAMLALLGGCRAEGVKWEPAVRLAAVTADVVATNFGVTSVNGTGFSQPPNSEDKPEARKLIGMRHAGLLVRRYRRDGHRVVLACGRFDVPNARTRRWLLEAAQQGEVLIVAIATNGRVHRRRRCRDQLHERQRATLVASLGCVDHVVLVEEHRLNQLLRRLRPDILLCEQVLDRDRVAPPCGPVHNGVASHARQHGRRQRRQEP
jgi:D-beta-D-heptose 7-phosphate kinase/D-beta-D-heptose 1-phosphate adenosyltransferase